jgi:hypothetical protein
MMMNEARLGVGFGAAMVGYRGYQYSLAYAKDRTQGRHPGSKPTDPTVPIIEHGDVRRMLLAQKSYVEGAMSLCFYAASLVDDLHTLAPSPEKTATAQLLDLLTPVVKAWPSEFGVKANDLAIQVLGGAGYTREYPVEQCWRDNRLNPIHEGTNGIQALDLLMRKLWQEKGAGLAELQKRMTYEFSKAKSPEAQHIVAKMTPYLHQMQQLLPSLGKAMGSKDIAHLSANAQCFMNIFSSLVMSWVWLRQVNSAADALVEESSLSSKDQAFYKGKLQAAKYYVNWELPLIQRDFAVLEELDDSCSSMQANWF